MKDFANFNIVSINTVKDVLRYYDKLYANYEMKTIPEIANDLNVDQGVIRKSLAAFYQGIRADGKISFKDLKVLLCTRFGGGSPYLEDQKNDKIQRLIKRRELERMYKLYNASGNQVLSDEQQDSKRR